jgi:hypothetical protein
MIEPALVHVLGDDADFGAFVARRPLAPFADVLVEFTGRLSQGMMGSAAVRRFPELVALAFWMRRANIQQLIKQQGQRLGGLVLPRGLVFHIAPSNVDTIFAYSWVLSLLCGNKNILRLSSRTSTQQELLIALLAECLGESQYAAIRDRVMVVRYEHSEAITGRFSLAANTRVIWGGDDTVAAIRRVPLNPLANEVTFGNRVSLAIIDAAGFLASDPAARAELCRLFANDAYVFGQAACSSPRAVLWRGEDAVPEAQREFWALVAGNVRKMDHDLGPAEFVNKRVAGDRVAIAAKVAISEEPGNLVTRIAMPLDVLPRELAGDTHCGAGLFFESRFGSWADLEPLLERRVQTLTYFGVTREEIETMLSQLLPQGVDRVVPVGSALAFSHQWEGLDLFDVFLRKPAII